MNDLAELSGQLASDTHRGVAAQGRASLPAPTNPAATSGDLATARTIPVIPSPSPTNSVQSECSEAVQITPDTHSDGDRFADPLVAEIVETWRQRQDMVRAQQKLTLQAKSICRRFTEGDKTAAEKLYQAVTRGTDHPLAHMASIAVMPLIAAQRPLIDTRSAYEKQLGKLGKRLPIAHMADQIKGVNYNTLATIVGEVGDMSAYEKGVAGIWKRAGLAVIDGERQRKKAGDAALIHGYSPSRHAVFWNVGGALLKAQGKDENAGPYRMIYDERKAYERPRVESDGHAHNRAMRFMVKRLLKDLWQSWKNTA